MRKFRILAALCAAFLLTIPFSTAAYAGGAEEAAEETSETESAVDETAAFTTDGTGTVVDSVTSEDNKQFYTITTPAGNVFYLIIDLAKESDNVYFLDAVTEKDLLALAEQSEDTEGSDGVSAVSGTDTDTEVTADTTTQEEDTAEDTGTEQETETDSGGNTGIMIFLVIAVLAVGGAGYYIKIVRPKQQAANDDDEEYEYGDKSDDEGNDDDYDFEDESGGDGDEYDGYEDENADSYDDTEEKEDE